MVGEVGRQSPSPRQPFTLAAMRSVTGSIQIEPGNKKYLGTFNTKEKAQAAYAAALSELVS